MDELDPRHGTSAGYCAGCRETCCRRGAAEYERQRIVRRYIGRGPLTVDGTGTRRRLQALTVLGWSSHALDAQLGQKRTYVNNLMLREGPILQSTAVKVAALYERLSMTLPPETTRGERVSASKARKHAAAQGWPPPLAWNDIDDPAEQPRDWAYTPTNRADQLIELVDRGDNLTQACRHLKLSRNTLNKWCIHTGNSHLYRALAAREGDWNSGGRIARDGAA